MHKVKNSPINYIKRSQIKSANAVVERASSTPKKRSAADFKNALIDKNFYVSFLADPEIKKQK